LKATRKNKRLTQIIWFVLVGGVFFYFAQQQKEASKQHYNTWNICRKPIRKSTNDNYKKMKITRQILTATLSANLRPTVPRPLWAV
jgi:hypothetical protein